MLFLAVCGWLRMGKNWVGKLRRDYVFRCVRVKRKEGKELAHILCEGRVALCLSLHILPFLYCDDWVWRYWLYVRKRLGLCNITVMYVSSGEICGGVILCRTLHY